MHGGAVFHPYRVSFCCFLQDAPPYSWRGLNWISQQPTVYLKTKLSHLGSQWLKTMVFKIITTFSQPENRISNTSFPQTPPPPNCCWGCSALRNQLTSTHAITPSSPVWDFLIRVWEHFIFWLDEASLICGTAHCFKYKYMWPVKPQVDSCPVKLRQG